MLFATSSARRRRVATVAATLSIALAGAAWSGCGSNEDQVTDAVNNALEDANQQADEISPEAQDAIDQASQDAQDAYDDATK